MIYVLIITYANSKDFLSPTTSLITASINDAKTLASSPAFLATDTDPVGFFSATGRAPFEIPRPLRTSGKEKKFDKSKSKMLGADWPACSVAKKVNRVKETFM